VIRVPHTRGESLAFVALLGLLGAAACGSSGSAGSTKSTIAPAVLPDAKPEAKSFFEEGLRLYHLGPAHFEKARGEFERAVKIDKNLFEAWHNLGLVEARLGRLADARESLARALKVQPGSRRTAVALAEAHGRAGQWDEAAAVLGKRVTAAPDDKELRFRYIHALREDAKLGEALEEVKGMLAKDSKSAAAFNALGLVYYRMEKYGLAESALRRAAELDPKAAVVWNNLGLVALARGHDQQAFQSFEKAIGLEPQYKEAHLNKAVVYLDCGDYKRAARELDKAADVDPKDPEVHIARGVAARGMKRFDEARALRPDHPAALYNLAILYMDFQENTPQNKKKARENLLLFRKVAASEDPRRADALTRLKELK
jgi:Flp pilus assembly protein TadD